MQILHEYNYTYKYKDTKGAAILHKYYANTITETPTQKTRTCAAIHNLWFTYGQQK